MALVLTLLAVLPIQDPEEPPIEDLRSLQAAFRDPAASAAGRAEVAETLARLGDAAPLRELAETLPGRGPSEQARILEGLARVNTPETRAILAELAADEELAPEARSAAEGALRSEGDLERLRSALAALLGPRPPPDRGILRLATWVDEPRVVVDEPAPPPSALARRPPKKPSKEDDSSEAGWTFTLGALTLGIMVLAYLHVRAKGAI
jgi:hypothetical protein